MLSGARLTSSGHTLGHTAIHLSIKVLTYMGIRLKLAGWLRINRFVILKLHRWVICTSLLVSTSLTTAPQTMLSNAKVALALQALLILAGVTSAECISGHAPDNHVIVQLFTSSHCTGVSQQETISIPAKDQAPCYNVKRSLNDNIHSINILVASGDSPATVLLFEDENCGGVILGMSIIVRPQNLLTIDNFNFFLFLGHNGGGINFQDLTIQEEVVLSSSLQFMSSFQILSYDTAWKTCREPKGADIKRYTWELDLYTGEACGGKSAKWPYPTPGDSPNVECFRIADRLVGTPRAFTFNANLPLSYDSDVVVEFFLDEQCIRKDEGSTFHNLLI